MMQHPTSADFRKDLAWSESAEIDAFFGAAFERTFLGLASWHPNKADNEGQRRGVDFVLYFANDTVLRVDAKADKWPPNNYFLEHISADTTNAPGWICKPLATDFIAYGFVNYGRCDFLPWHSLRLAWHRHGQDWRQEYGDKWIQNRGYRTCGVAVPIPVVQAAMLEVMSPLVTPAVHPSPPAPAAPEARVGRRISNLDEFKELWPKFYRVRLKKKYGTTIAAYLHEAEPVGFTEMDAVLEFKKEFHYEKACEAAKRLPFEADFNEVLVAPHRLKFRLADPCPRAPQPVSVTACAVGIEDDEDEDVFKVAKDLFAAQVVARSGQ